jgi:hypothetical protein
MFSKFVEDFYHVIMRNGYQQSIFLDDADKMEYLKNIARGSEEAWR